MDDDRCSDDRCSDDRSLDDKYLDDKCLDDKYTKLTYQQLNLKAPYTKNTNNGLNKVTVAKATIPLILKRSRPCAEKLDSESNENIDENKEIESKVDKAKDLVQRSSSRKVSDHRLYEDC